MIFEILKRYKKTLIIWIIFIVVFVASLLLNGLLIGSLNIYTILTQNFWYDTILIFLLIPILSIAAYFLGGYLFAPLLIILHKKLLGRSLIYGIEERDKPSEFKRAFIKSIFPALMAFNIAILLSDMSAIHDFIFIPSLTLPPAVRQILTITILLPIVSAIGIATFSAAFFLIDSGIEYSNKKQKKVRDGAYPTELRSIGTYYLYFLKGYAGIAVIIGITKLLIEYLISLQGGEALIYLINLLTWPFMPFAIALFMVPAVIIQDYTYDSRNRFVRKWANKFGISGRIQDPLARNNLKK
ncbi:MAG: hypothetical protein ACFE9S_09040 [Candidatus Hermodarchaeota archaeon]